MRKHSACIFDICNYYGHNGGAWADLYGDDLIVFGGSWWGDINSQCDTRWMPGVFRFDLHCAAADQCALRVWKKGADMSYGSVAFAVIGNVAAIVKRCEQEDQVLPEDFKDVTFITIDKALALIDRQTV